MYQIIQRSPVEELTRCGVAGIGAAVAYLQPTFPYFLVCTLAVLFDCFSAWMLSRRVRRRYPEKTNGKFKSHHFGRVIETLIKVYCLIILAYIIDVAIFDWVSLKLANIAAGAVCFWQVWSILENEASCNEAKWARVAQKVLVDKTERHFDVDLSDLKKSVDDEQKINQQ